MGVAKKGTCPTKSLALLRTVYIVTGQGALQRHTQRDCIPLPSLHLGSKRGHVSTSCKMNRNDAGHFWAKEITKKMLPYPLFFLQLQAEISMVLGLAAPEARTLGFLAKLRNAAHIPEYQHQIVW